MPDDGRIELAGDVVMSSSVIDYRDLLKRYMAYVALVEGVIPGLHAADEGWFKTGFRPEERDALRALAKEATSIRLPEPTDEDYS